MAKGSLEARVGEIEDRNSRVELDKAWETSNFRKLSIFVLTYLVMVLFMHFAAIERPFISAVIPAIGFILSTLTMGYLKKWWIDRQ